MKKLILIFTLIFTLLFFSCEKPSISTSVEGRGFEVEFLFEKDGIKVYRFYDCGRNHYFTTLGETISTPHHDDTNYDENIYLKK